MITACRLPRDIVRGENQTLRLRLLQDNGVTEITPESVEVTLFAGDVQVGTYTGVAGVECTAVLPAADTGSLELSDDLLEQWRVVVDSKAHVVRRSAFLVRHRLFATVTVEDLWTRHDELYRVENLDRYINNAWDDLVRELIARGNRPQLVMEASALHRPHLFLALAMVYEDLEASTGDERYARLAGRYLGRHESTLASTRMRYDFDENGTHGGVHESKEAVSPVLWLNMPPGSRRHR